MKDVWKSINQIQSDCDLSDSKVANILSLSLNRFQQVRKNSGVLNVEAVLNFIHYFGIDPDRFIAGVIDFKALASSYTGNSILPERYLYSAFSRKRTAATVVRYAEEVFGKQESLRLLRRLQIPADALLDLEGLTNVWLVTDICNEFAKRFGSNRLIHVGMYSSNLNTTEAVNSSFQGCASPVEVFEKGVLEITPKYFDTNFDYKIEFLDKERCVIASRPSERLKEGMKNFKPGSMEISLYRTGTFATFLSFAGFHPEKAQLLTSIYEGSDACRHEISFQQRQNYPCRRFSK